MILTRKFLNEMFRIWGDRIDKPLEEYLLATYEEDPFPHEWSEQVRKLIFQYQEGKLDIAIPTAEERQKIRYEALKDSYIDLLRETIYLREIIQKTKSIIETSTENSMLQLY